MAGVTDAAECLNCGSPLSGAYCSHCGQKALRADPTFLDLARELTHELVSVDGKVVRTAWLLLRKPGFLTLEYFEGRRARYLSPIRLYLTASVIFFAATAMWVSQPIFSPEEQQEIQALVASGFASPTGQVDLAAAFNVWTPRVMFVLVPLFAALVMLVTRRVRRRFPQHLCFALHVHAAYFAIAGLSAVPDYFGWTSWASAMSWVRTLLPLAYLVIAFHAAYGGRWPLAVGRTVAVYLVYITAVGMAVSVIALSAFA